MRVTLPSRSAGHLLSFLAAAGMASDALGAAPDYGVGSIIFSAVIAAYALIVGAIVAAVGAGFGKNAGVICAFGFLAAPYAYAIYDKIDRKMTISYLERKVGERCDPSKRNHIVGKLPRDSELYFETILRPDDAQRYARYWTRYHLEAGYKAAVREDPAAFGFKGIFPREKRGEGTMAIVPRYEARFSERVLNPEDHEDRQILEVQLNVLDPATNKVFATRKYYAAVTRGQIGCRSTEGDVEFLKAISIYRDKR